MWIPVDFQLVPNVNPETVVGTLSHHSVNSGSDVLVSQHEYRTCPIEAWFESKFYIFPEGERGKGGIEKHPPSYDDPPDVLSTT